MIDPPSYPGAPRWLKLSTIAAGGMALLFVVLLHGGSGPQHNPPSIGGLGHHVAREGGP